MDSFENQPRPGEFEVPMKDSNMMQRDLIIRARNSNKVEPLQWINENREKFRRLITDKPELCLGYSQESEEEKLKMLEDIEQELYSE